MSQEEKPIPQDGSEQEKSQVRAPGRWIVENGVVLSQNESDQEMQERLDGGWRKGLK